MIANVWATITVPFDTKALRASLFSLDVSGVLSEMSLLLFVAYPLSSDFLANSAGYVFFS